MRVKYMIMGNMEREKKKEKKVNYIKNMEKMRT